MYWLKLLCLWLADRIESAGDPVSLSLAENLRHYHANERGSGGVQLMYHAMDRSGVRLSRFVQTIDGSAVIGLGIPSDDAYPIVGVIVEIPLTIGREDVIETRFTVATPYEMETACASS